MIVLTILMQKALIDSIPLIIYENELGKFLADIQVDIEGSVSRFLFDTGAAKSQIKSDESTKDFKKVGEKESKGASGIGYQKDVVEVPTLKFGNFSLKNMHLDRGQRGIFGIDLLKDCKFEINFQDQKICFFKELETREKINWLKRGHLTMSLFIDDIQTSCLFDTGANTTVVDEKFVRGNPDKFELIGTEEGKDVNGNKIPSNVYRCKKIEIGNLK